jgi:glycosyltransferase involved in cell wall biosynthesis
VLDDVGETVKVMYFSREYTPHDHRFLEALSKSGHSISFLQLERSGGLESRPVPDGVRQVPWPWRRKGRSRLRTLALVRDLKGVLQREQPDVVHAGPIQSPAFLTALAGFHPLVSMSWGSDMLLGARRGIGRWAARYTLKRSDAFACDCDAVRQKALELGMPSERIVVFPWGVDLVHFSPKKETHLRSLLGWQDAFIVISTRVWERLTGVDVLVEGFLRAAKAEPSLRLLLLGNGSLRADISERIRESDMIDRVYMPGQVRYADLPGYFRSADLYLSASTSDGSSVSLMEALACGCPTLVSDIPGNREWVEPGKHGWWFETGNAADLEAKLLQALAERDRNPAMRKAARELAEERANWKQNFLKLLDAYELARSFARQGAEGKHARVR